MNIKIVKNINKINFEEAFNLIKLAGLSTVDLELHKKSFVNSQVTVFIYNDETLIGVGRAISDYVRHGAIYDLAVLPIYQGRGIGRIIIQEIKNELVGCNLILYASPGKEGFYENLGFRKMKTGMAIFDNEDSMKERGFIY